MVNTKFCVFLGPGRTGLTNLFGPTKISTKFVSAKFSICQAWAH